MTTAVAEGVVENGTGSEGSHVAHKVFVGAPSINRPIRFLESLSFPAPMGMKQRLNGVSLVVLG